MKDKILRSGQPGAYDRDIKRELRTNKEKGILWKIDVLSNIAPDSKIL